jgi:hypothetical protein
VSEDVDVIIADEFSPHPFALQKAGKGDVPHKTVQHNARIYVDGDVTTDGIERAFSLLKRSEKVVQRSVLVRGGLPMDEMSRKREIQKVPVRKLLAAVKQGIRRQLKASASTPKPKKPK